ncbi:MAG TPA: prepilin peptidase [Xanthobacteraceae bacterium]|nr:prepilin peptidase [Xanthobacteraceae bacterium]
MIGEMQEAYLADAALAATALVLLYAAYVDLARYQISNEIILLLGALFVVHVVLSGRWSELPRNTGIALLVFLVLLYFYARNWLGGGDVKLLTVGFLWAGVECALPFAVLLSLFAFVHVLAGKIGWVKLTKSEDDARSRMAFAPAVAASLISLFVLGCLAPVR